MQMSIKRSLLAATLIGLFSITAQATPITYSFSGSSTYTSYAQSAGGETVTITATSTNGNSLVKLNSNGLGVVQVSGGGSNTVDATSGRTESLLFSFDESFKLLSFSLDNAQSNESFILSWGLGALTTGTESVVPIGSTLINPYSVVGNAVGDWFQISATRNGSTQSSFYISNLTIDTVSRNSQTVPEPGSLLLAALGLAGLTLVRKR